MPHSSSPPSPSAISRKVLRPFTATCWTPRAFKPGYLASLDKELYQAEYNINCDFSLRKGCLNERITSAGWAKFLDNVKKAKADLGNPDTLWYRGHSNADFYLLATLLRYENGLEKEQFLYASFQKFADRLLKRRDSEWETLFEMQHYGVPTRLLDWSETFGIALFFAAHYNQIYYPDKNAAIYLLDPVALNRLSSISEVYRVPKDEGRFSYTAIYWRRSPFAASAPIAIEPIFINDRMLAQRGMFTVHHDSIEPLEKKFPTAIKKVMLPSEVIPAAMEFLNLSNINMYSVFPDLAGIARYLADYTGLKRR